MTKVSNDGRCLKKVEKRRKKWCALICPDTEGLAVFGLVYGVSSI